MYKKKKEKKKGKINVCILSLKKGTFIISNLILLVKQMVFCINLSIAYYQSTNFYLKHEK